MKTLRTICLLLAALAIIKVTAYSAPKDPTAIYKAGEVQVQAIAFTETPNFKDFDSGGGAAVTYWVTKNIGAGFESKTKDTHNAFFDALGFNVAGRLPIAGGFAPFAKAGFDWDAEASSHSQTRNEFDLYVGAGIEKRFSHGIGLGAEARIVRDYEFERNERYQFSAFLSKAF